MYNDNESRYDQAKDEKRVLTYRLNLHQLSLTDEFSGYVAATREAIIANTSFAGSPEREPCHTVSVSGKVEHHYKGYYPPFKFKGTPINLTGAEITIYESEEKFPEFIIDVLDAAFLTTGISLSLPKPIFKEFIDLLRGNKMVEVLLLCEAYLDNPQQPEALHLRFFKVWIINHPVLETRRLTMIQIILAIVLGLTLFDWMKGLLTDSKFMSLCILLVCVCGGAYVFWPPVYIKPWLKKRQYWKEVEKRNAKRQT